MALRLFCIIALFQLSHSRLHDDQQKPLQPRPAHDSLKRPSSLFSAGSVAVKPPSGQSTINAAFCCGPLCPPGRCNVKLPPNDAVTDLAWLYATRTTTHSSHSAYTRISFPCCHEGCADGACRESPGFSSQRPPLAARTTPAPGDTPGDQSGGGSDNLVRPPPGQRHPGDADGDGWPDDSENAGGWGCCLGCTGCRYSLAPDPTSFLEAMIVRATVTATAESNVLEQADRCIGCAGGRCYPCRGRKVKALMALPPDTLIEPTPASPVAEAATKVVNAAKSVIGQTTQADSEGPQPTDPIFLFGNDFTDAIRGLNQDILPVVVQAFPAEKDDLALAKPESGQEYELFTLLATVDPKVQENYISRAAVHALGRSHEIVRLSTKVKREAVLNSNLDTVQVEGYLDMGIAIGSLTGSGVTDRLLKGVRWNVFDDSGASHVPDVLLGMKILGEVGGIVIGSRGIVIGSITAGEGKMVGREVHKGIRVLGIAHEIDPVKKSTEKGGAGGGGKDEL